MNIRKILMSSLCAVFVTTAHAEWCMFNGTDEMTDEVSFILACEGELVNTDLILNRRPSLVIRIKPKEYNTLTKKVLSDIDVYFVPHVAVNDRYAAKVRFDKNPAEERKFSKAITGDAGFFDSQYDFISRIKESNSVLLRFRTYGFGDVTARFDVAGYKKAVDAMCSDISKDKIGSVKYK